ncbi:MAG: hypothetical protein HY554_03480 [Elusimicrobia bacterium]|nr:hypothetical protein [Elusimicrobiota bacterium]
MTTGNSEPLAAAAEPGTIDSVLLIDGDNDPHLPPNFEVSDRALVRVFVRMGAKLPRTLERRLAALPRVVTVVSPRGGGNAADFVMSLHAGILHATLPMHLPFTLVTADRSLGVMADELQRVGRQAVLWTSHEPRGGRRRAAPAARRPSSSGTPEDRDAQPAQAPATRRRRRGRRPAAAVPTAPASPAPQPDRRLAEAGAAYAARLARIKDPPSRLKTLLNDIRHRSASAGFSPEEILEELKRSHGLLVDGEGHVRVKRAS